MTQQDLQRYCFYRGLQMLEESARPEVEKVVVRKKLKPLEWVARFFEKTKVAICRCPEPGKPLTLKEIIMPNHSDAYAQHCLSARNALKRIPAWEKVKGAEKSYEDFQNWLHFFVGTLRAYLGDDEDVDYVIDALCPYDEGQLYSDYYLSDVAPMEAGRQWLTKNDLAERLAIDGDQADAAVAAYYASEAESWYYQD